MESTRFRSAEQSGDKSQTIRSHHRSLAAAERLSNGALTPSDTTAGIRIYLFRLKHRTAFGTRKASIPAGAVQECRGKIPQPQMLEVHMLRLLRLIPAVFVFFSARGDR